MKVIVDDKIPFIRGQVERIADEVVYLPGAAITVSDVRDTDALLIRTRTLCNRQLLEGSRVRLIVTATIGYDHLDTQYLKEAGIAWTNCPGCNATSVAQYVRNACLESESQGLTCLREATLGIVGYGHVGKAVYKALRPYVKEIVLNDPPQFENEELRIKNEELTLLHSSLEGLQTNCDIITLHTPLTFDGPHPTHHLVDKTFLDRLTRKPLLINAARGGVVDEEALEKALDEGRIRQAIIDTWEGEPQVRRSLLDKVFIGTPHIAGYSADGKANATRMTLKALAKHFQSSVSDFQISIPTAPPERTGLNYSPTADSRLLKTNPTSFEYQRGHYPLRREGE